MATKKISTESSIANTYKLSRGVASAAIPNAPTIGTATKVNDVSATVTYTAAVLGATASSFSALSSPGSLTGTGSSPITISGLTPETTYTFTVRATNANGNSAYSEASNSITTDPVLDSGAMFPLGMVNVGSGGAANITFSSIPSTYKHLQIRLSAQGTAGYDVNVRLNSDTGSNYAFHYLSGQGSSAGSGAGTSTTYINFSNNFLQGATIPAVGIMDILDYVSTSKYKTTRTLSGSDANGSGWLQLGSGLWQNTAAITTIQLFPASSQTFSQYTSAALYGIKGA